MTVFQFNSQQFYTKVKRKRDKSTTKIVTEILL